MRIILTLPSLAGSGCGVECGGVPRILTVALLQRRKRSLALFLRFVVRRTVEEEEEGCRGERRERQCRWCQRSVGARL